MTETAGPRRRPLGAAALAGVLAAASGLAIAELLAALVEPRSSPLSSVGSLVIDLAPPWLKDTTIALFGTQDKLVLLIAIGVLVALLAAAAGLIEARRPPLGRVLIAAVIAVNLVATLTRSDASAVSVLPSLAALLVSVPLLAALLRAARRDDKTGSSRRQFLAWAGTSGAAAVLAAIGASALASVSRAADAVRESLRLPRPADPSPAIPEGVELGVDGVADFVTPNPVFYRIDTALAVPRPDPERWRLRITGLVENEVELGYRDLLSLPLVERAVTLACVSNEVGGGLIGNALWLGYPIRELLARAVPERRADMVLSRSIDGFTASTPLEVLTDERDALLAVGMNGEPLPPEHGYPVRMVVPGLYGYVSATKWVTELKVTRFDDELAYWSTRGWSTHGPIKTASRIDVPTHGSAVDAGHVMVGGMAWAQHVGIDTVEVRIDEGEWMPARLGEELSTDTWRQWALGWDAEPGLHRITVRATDRSGYTQTSEEAPPAPDGATGWHSIQVRAR